MNSLAGVTRARPRQSFFAHACTLFFVDSLALCRGLVVYANSNVLLHRFGPAGDPRGAGIGTKEAIQLVWSCHREIISDVGPVPVMWTTPAST